ncbi:MAG: hypothetical protein LW832_06390 [Parachlamydia sp.]|jgi:hypothetical protein|nr:hypothetical protein [Parachlamydia sp.]
MIELSYPLAFMLYLGALLFAVLLVWVKSHYRTRQREILPPEEKLFICEYCQCAYLEQANKKINQCMQCGLLNKF